VHVRLVAAAVDYDAFLGKRGLLVDIGIAVQVVDIARNANAVGVVPGAAADNVTPGAAAYSIGFGKSPAEGYPLNSAMTGAWSDGRSSLRGSLSMLQATQRLARSAETRIWSMRRPALRRKPSIR